MKAAQGAQVIPVPPPLMYGVGFGLGMRLHRAMPLPVGGRPFTAVAGAVGVAGGTALVMGGASEILRHRTTIIPHHAVSTLVTSGVYKYTRNPMYTGLAIAYAGGSLAVGSWWPLAGLPGVLLVVRRLVIDPEERYLAQRFGDAYAEYRRRVRRWL